MINLTDHFATVWVKISTLILHMFTLRLRRLICLWSASVCKSSLSDEASRFSGSLMLGGMITRTAADLFDMAAPAAVELSAALLLFCDKRKRITESLGNSKKNAS